MISYSRQQKALEELAELDKISEQKKKEQEEQNAVELFKQKTADIEDVKLIEFDQSKHRRYSNYMAVNVDDIKQIPDTNEIIGVPITFLDKYNPEQFEILGMSGDREFVDSDCDFFIPVTKEQKKHI